MAGGAGANIGLIGSYNVICSVTGIYDNYVYHQIAISPNPASNQISIKFKYFDSFKEGNSTIEVIDLNGKKVLETASLLHITNEQNIDISELQSGLYFLRLKTADFLINQKFIKQ